jgi:hypothetical protein
MAFLLGIGRSVVMMIGAERIIKRIGPWLAGAGRPRFGEVEHSGRASDRFGNARRSGPATAVDCCGPYASGPAPSI